jgi:hypothetical protein
MPIVIIVLDVGDSAMHLHSGATATTQEEDLAAGTGMANGLGLPLLLPRCHHMIKALGEQPCLHPQHASSSMLTTTAAITSAVLGDRRKTAQQPSTRMSWISRGMKCHGPRSGPRIIADHLCTSIKICC